MEGELPVNEVPESSSNPAETAQPQNNGEFISYYRKGWEKLKDNKKLFSIIRNSFFTALTIAIAGFVYWFVVFFTPFLQEHSSVKSSIAITDPELLKDPGYKKQISTISRDLQRLQKKYNSYTSGQSYLVINTTDNRFFLYRSKKLVREGFCSSGSYKMLQTVEGKSWTFKTPKGKFSIQGKTTNPTWIKPDWAFVEEGLPIPPKNHDSRYEYGVLGDYAMALGDGYLIHGTIYKRFLGMPVTHGCVRLNDEDLEAIYNTMSIGSKVYIF